MLLVRALTQSLKIISIVFMTGLVLIGSVAFFNYWTDRERSEDIGRPVTITISEEDDGATVSEKLLDAELIKYGVYFETKFRFSGDDFQPGTYTLRHGMSVTDIINTISVPSEDDPEVTAAAPGQAIKVTFIEGQRIEQYAQTLVDAGWEGDPQAFIDAAYNPVGTDQWEFLNDLPDGASLEGFLFPNTYDIPSNAKADDVILYLLNGFDTAFTDDMRKEAKDSGRTVYEVVTLASIVEREAQAEGERVTIAGLYLNRLDAGMPLQADPTTQYAVGTADEWWPQLNTELIAQAADDPYNTYNEAVVALPPGPIANPGQRSMQAALQPEEHEFLYMQAKFDEAGTHAFSSSLEEHNANICEFQPDAEICGGGSSEEPGSIDLAIAPLDRRWMIAG